MMGGVGKGCSVHHDTHRRCNTRARVMNFTALCPRGSVRHGLLFGAVMAPASASEIEIASGRAVQGVVWRRGTARVNRTCIRNLPRLVLRSQANCRWNPPSQMHLIRLLVGKEGRRCVHHCCCRLPSPKSLHQVALVSATGRASAAAASPI